MSESVHAAHKVHLLAADEPACECELLGVTAWIGAHPKEHMISPTAWQPIVIHGRPVLCTMDACGWGQAGATLEERKYRYAGERSGFDALPTYSRSAGDPVPYFSSHQLVGSLRGKESAILLSTVVVRVQHRC